MIEIFGSAWMQMSLWVIAAAMAFYFDGYMKTGSIAWTILSIGVLLYGFRIGYKLLPFYEQTQVLRYVIGIIGLVFLFIGLVKYCSSVRATAANRG